MCNGPNPQYNPKQVKAHKTNDSCERGWKIEYFPLGKKIDWLLQDIHISSNTAKNSRLYLPAKITEEAVNWGWAFFKKPPYLFSHPVSWIEDFGIMPKSNFFAIFWVWRKTIKWLWVMGVWNKNGFSEIPFIFRAHVTKKKGILK